MPELSKMTCVVCERVFKIEEIDLETNLCLECTDALKDIPELEGDESDAEIRKVVAQYQKRKEYQKKYNMKPNIVQVRKEYQKARREREKVILEKARKLGLI